jgi:hypothetical protein
MKFIFSRASLLCFAAFFHNDPATGQNIITREGEYMDTGAASPPIDIAKLNNYYSVGGKYPKSSSTLLKEAKAFVEKKNYGYDGSGYITFRFVVDTTGAMRSGVRVMQTDEYYQEYHFDKRLVSKLFAWLKTLDQWKISRPLSGAAQPYRAFMTFKIKDGKIINVIP